MALGEAAVKCLPVPKKKKSNKIHYFAGDTVQGQTAPKGFGVRVTSGGSKAFVLSYRVAGKEHRFTIGEWKDSSNGGAWSVIAAIKHARELRRKIDTGGDPLKERKKAKAPAVTGKTVSDVLDEHVQRYLKKEGLRSADYIARQFDRLVKPSIGKVGIYDIRRSQITSMLDKIEDKNGAVMADRTLAYVRKALNWYATRDDEFRTPIVRDMARTKSKDRARQRT